MEQNNQSSMYIYGKNLLLLILFLLICGASIFGTVVPENVPTLPVGNMHLSPFFNGLAFFQNGRNYYYAISPFNDYATVQNKRVSFISREEVKKNSYNTNFNTNQWSRIMHTVSSYFGILPPSITFYTKEKTISYTSTVTGNAATITQDLSFHTPIELTSTGITIVYQKMDFLYDKLGNLYEYQTDTARDEFEKNYGIHLHTSSSLLQRQVLQNTLTIVNPRMATAMVIHGTSKQHIFVNRDAGLIEIEQDIDPAHTSYINSFRISVFNTPQEAKNSL